MPLLANCLAVAPPSEGSVVPEPARSFEPMPARGDLGDRGRVGRKHLGVVGDVHSHFALTIDETRRPRNINLRNTERNYAALFAITLTGMPTYANA